MNTLRDQFSKRQSKGAALIIVLSFVVLLTGLALAYFSRTTTDRQLAKSSFDNTAADLLARSALDIVVSDFKQEIINNPAIAAANIQPTRYGTPSPGETPIPNLIRRSFSGDPTGRTSSVSSGAVSANGRSISTARWNRHYLIPRGNTGTTIDSSPVPSFNGPDWVLITSQGPNTAPAPSAVIGRYGFAVYDEGGLLDMTLAGYATGTGAGGGPNPSPTPWLTNVGRKGIVAFADLTALPSAPTTTFPQNQINNIVGWRNFASSQQLDGSFGSPVFLGNLNKQDSYGSYLLDFGDPPYPSPCPIYPFTSVATDTSSSRTDQAFVTRQELLKLRSSLNFSQNVLQYMGTFSRERNQPARDWSSLNNKLPDRFDISMLSLAKPNPTGTPPSRGKGKGKGRGRYRGDATSILNLFGLQWVAANASVTDPRQVAYWNHWRYVGSPGVPPNSNPHVPALRGGRNDFFQILDYAMTQANANTEDTSQPNVADIMSLGASLIDQNDAPSDDADVGPTHPTGTHITIIETDSSGHFVLGWENGEALAAADTDPSSPKNPYNWLTDPYTSTTKPLPSFTPIVLNHAFSTVGDFGYGLRPEYAANRFQRVDFHIANPNANLLDFFTYNPVDHNYPRAGIVNLNTKNVPVIAAILQSALKTDVDVSPLPNPFPTVAPGEATLAAQDIVNATSAAGGAALSRADIGRLTGAAAARIGNPGYTGEQQEKVPEAIARALCEVTQTRTWNLMVDVIAQTGRYVPGATELVDPIDPTKTQFIVEGEKRNWLHIAVGRDLNGGTVDVIGQQLEEVIE